MPKAKPRVFGAAFFFALFVSSCGSDDPVLLKSSGPEIPVSFFLSRRAKDLDRQKVLEKSRGFYKGEGLCSSSPSCAQVCEELFSISQDREDCGKLQAPQVYQFQKLSQNIRKKDLASLQKVNVFDLKVFLSLSLEPFFQSVRALGPFYAKIFLHWIAGDWQTASVFRSEDWDFFLLENFLNEIAFSPISSLREEIGEGRTFVELAWIKQNDPALFWLDDYFKSSHCAGFKGPEAENCSLSRYCLLSESFQSDVLREIMVFSRLKPMLKSQGHLPQKDLMSFCSAFCLSEKGQNYCK